MIRNMSRYIALEVFLNFPRYESGVCNKLWGKVYKVCVEVKAT